MTRPGVVAAGLLAASAVAAEAQPLSHYTDTVAPSCQTAQVAEGFVIACYVDPTDRYGHNALGPGLEWAALEVELWGPQARFEPVVSELGVLETPAPSVLWRARLTLPETQVFEDAAPRFMDITGDGAPEIVTILSDAAEGAALVAYGFGDDGVEIRAQTAPIGTAFRWLAPVGAADFDGDGDLDLAYVDRPHLVGALRLVEVDGYRLRPMRFADGQAATLRKVTNHRYGDPEIVGGVRVCGDAPEIVVSDFWWSSLRILRVTRDGFVDVETDLPPTAAGFAEALTCAE